MCKKNKSRAIKCAIRPGDMSLWARTGMFRMRNGEYIRTPSTRDLLSRIVTLVENGIRSECCITCANHVYCEDASDPGWCSGGNYTPSSGMTILDKCDAYEPCAGLEETADRLRYLAIALWPIVYVHEDGREIRRVVIKGITLCAENSAVHHKIVQ